MAAGDKHAGAFRGKMLSDAEANAGAAARDDSDFACKLPGHGDFLSGWVAPSATVAMIYCADRAGKFENSGPNPSAIVRCAITASRSFG